MATVRGAGTRSLTEIMSEILVFVNDTLTCSVICDEADRTLASFRADILDKQVDDILCFPYKFTRPVNDTRIVVGLKQEASCSASRCIDSKTDGKSIFLVREESKPVEINPTEQSASSQETVTEGILVVNEGKAGNASTIPAKQRNVSRQPSILEFANQRHKLPKPHPYSAARARKIKIYSKSEIEGSTGLTQVYRRFWNSKAEEICSSQSLASFKAGEIQGAINVAWTLEKSKHLKQEVVEITAEIGQPCSITNMKKLQASAKTIEKNTHRVEEAHESLNSTQHELADARFELFQAPNSCQRKKANEKVDKLEKDLEVNLTELRKAQDALRKSIDTKRKIISDLQQDQFDVDECEAEIASDSESADSLQESKTKSP